MAITAAAVPAMLCLAFLARTGRASLDTMASLEKVAPLDVGGRGTVFPYLDDTVTDSISKVLDRRPVLSFVVGAVLLGLVWFLARRLVPCLRALLGWALPTRGLQIAWTAGLGACTVLLFSLGFDWMRWITSVTLSAMLAAGAVVVLAADATTRPSGIDPRWFGPVPSRGTLSLPSMAALAVGIYLLVLSPLPPSVHNVDQLARLLVNAPG